jgi:hypothetical protein
MDNDAPATKVLHYAKPSEELGLRQNLFSQHLKRVKRVEDKLMDVMTKLNQVRNFVSFRFVLPRFQLRHCLDYFLTVLPSHSISISTPYQWNTFFGLDQFGQVPEPSPDDENNSVTGGGTEPGQGLAAEPGVASAPGLGLGESSLDGGTSMGDLSAGDL